MGLCSSSEGSQGTNPSKFNDDDVLNQVTLTGQTSAFELDKKMTLLLQSQQNPIQLNPMFSAKLPIQVQINIDDIEAHQTAPIDIVIVIDHSGSMSGGKMRLVKESCEHLLTHLGPRDRVSLIKFDFEATRITPLRRMTDANKRKAVEEIENLVPEGGTNITAGMEIALEVIHKRRYVNAVTSILLLSDGTDEYGEQGVRDLLAKYEFNDIFTIHTFGFGVDHDAHLMQAIANTKDGNFYFIEELDTIDECFVDCLGGLISVVADNAILQVLPLQSQLLPNLQITKAYGVDGSWVQNGGTYQINIAHLMSGREKNLILELEIPLTQMLIPEGSVLVKVAQAQLTVSGLFGRQKQLQSVVKTADLTLTVINPGVISQQNIIDGNVTFHYYRVKGAELIALARLASDKGSFDEGKMMLQGLVEEMKSSPMQTHEDFADLVKDFEAMIQFMQPSVYSTGGKHHLIQHGRNHMDERSNIHSNVQYGNKRQSDMVNAARSRKVKNYM